MKRLIHATDDEILYIIKDRFGNQLSRPNPDDNELWDRVDAIDGDGRRGMHVVVYTGTTTVTGSTEDNYTYDQFINDCIAQVEWSYKLGQIEDPYDVEQICGLIESKFPEDLVFDMTKDHYEWEYDIRNNVRINR